jgi:hypothetical protein
MIKPQRIARHFLAALLLVPLSPLHAADASQSTKKPNIILIMADDLGYAALRCYGQKLILTPELDKLAAAGMRFTDFYAANTVCVPSRVSLLPGMHPGHAPIRDNFLPHLPEFSGYMQEASLSLVVGINRMESPTYRPRNRAWQSDTRWSGHPGPCAWSRKTDG